MSITAIALAASLIAGGASAETLRLSCLGTATRTVASVSGTQLRDNEGNTASGETTNYRSAQSDERLLIEIADGQGRVRLPNALVPLLSGGGTDGWWNLSDVQVGEDEIVGHYALNYINHPTIRIDRHSGRIEVDERARTFRGACEAMADQPRKF